MRRIPPTPVAPGDYSDPFAEALITTSVLLGCKHRSPRRRKNGIAPCAPCAREADNLIIRLVEIMTMATVTVWAE